MEFKQSKKWAMNIPLSTLIKTNKTCKVNRNYKAHWSDGAFHGISIYMTYPNHEEEHSVNIAIAEDGFVYVGDYGCMDDYEEINTEIIMNEMVEFRDKAIRRIIYEQYN